MLDRFNRKITYLRVSVTDRCNLRCVYCMPEDGIPLKNHKDILSFDEIVEVCKAGIDSGINKIRITGGEPLVRKGIVNLTESIAKLPGLEDLSMTTNGILLDQFAQKLKDAGLMRVNISLDTLDPDEYRRITRGGEITDVIKGIVAAQKAGLEPIKINSVIFDKDSDSMKEGLKDFAKKMGLQVRFISRMDLETGDFSVVEGGTGGDCRICNRLRLTANGYIKPCLFSDSEFSVRESGAREAIMKAVEFKPEKGISCMHGNFYNIGG
jgi:GTP 3',8-cyclase